MAVNLDALWLAHETRNTLHNGGGEFGTGAWVDCETDTLIVYSGEGVDDEPPPPDDINDNPRYLPVPTRHELNLGRQLALDFMHEHWPEEIDWARETLHCRGGWHRFKSRLEARGLMRQWFDYQEQRTMEALRAWCEANGITVE